MTLNFQITAKKDWLGLRLQKTTFFSNNGAVIWKGKVYQMKKWIHPTSTVAPYKFTSKSEDFPTWAPLPNPKEMKASLSKVQAFKFILQNAASKLRLFQTSIFKFYLLSPISALLLPTCSTSSFQKLVEKVQNYIKEFWLI